jgi:hypothetical protein
MGIEAAYLVHSQVVRLGEIPFTAGKASALRGAQRPLFASKRCFSDNRLAFVDSTRIAYSPETPFPSMPFLRHLGSLVFDTHRLVFGGWREQTEVAETLSERTDFWNPGGAYRLEENEWRNVTGVFGFDPDLDDQRMNHLYFEARHPLFLRATTGTEAEGSGVTAADGRCFVHVYPSGYLVFHFAIAFTEPVLQTYFSLYDAIRETRFWRPGGRWRWHSRLGDGGLGEQVAWVRDAVYGSLWCKRPDTLREGEWHSALKLSTSDKAHEVARGLRFRVNNTLSVSSEPVLEWDEGIYRQYRGIYWSEIASTDQGLVHFFSPTYKRRTSRRHFWETQALHEFVLLKQQIYNDYAAFLRREINNLKAYRLSTRAKLVEEDVRRLTAYDPTIPRYLLALDKHIQSAPPAARRIYSFLSEESGFDKQRTRLKELVGEWEAAAAEWEHPLMLVWRRLLAPLVSLLGK